MSQRTSATQPYHGIPARDEQGIPTAWVARMRESMARLTPRFSANRAVRDYTEQHYLPAAAACRSRMADKGAIAAQMTQWRQNLQQKWASLRFGEVKVQTPVCRMQTARCGGAAHASRNALSFENKDQSRRA